MTDIVERATAKLTGRRDKIAIRRGARYTHDEHGIAASVTNDGGLMVIRRDDCLYSSAEIRAMFEVVD